MHTGLPILPSVFMYMSFDLYMYWLDNYVYFKQLQGTKLAFFQAISVPER